MASPSRVHPIPVRPDPRPRRRRSTWTMSVAVLVIVGAMGALMVLPRLAHRRVEDLRHRIDETVLPARHQVARVGESLAMEIAATRGYALTGDAAFIQDFERAQEVEAREMSRLRRLAPDLGEATVSALERFERTKARWLVPILDLMQGRVDRAEYTRRLRDQQDRFEAVLGDLRALDDAVGGAERALRDQMRTESDWEQRVVVLSLLCAVAALVALALVGRRLQRLARLLRYRAEEERALRKVARSLSAATSVREVVQHVVDASVGTTRAFGAYVERAERDHVTVVAVAGQGVPQVGLQVPYPGSLTEALIESGEPGVITEIGAIGDSMAPYLKERCDACTGLVVPLLSEGRALGALVLLRSAEQHSFSEEESSHARALGDLASAALRRVTLLEETQREREALAASEQQFRSLAERTNAAVLVIAEDDTIVFANATAETVFGYPVAELLGRPMSSLMPEEMRARHRAGIERYVRTGVRNIRWENVHLPGLRRDGTVVPLEVTLGDFVREGRRYFTGIARDISERQAAEAERERLLAAERQAREQIEAAVRARDDVLAIVSHDLRNPLNTISLGLATLRELPPDKQPIALATVRRAVERMNRLIQDLLDVTRLEAGRKLSFNLGQVDVAAVLGEVVEAFRAQAQSRRIELSCEAQSGLPPVRADRDRVFQVLSNLLGNALKFTPELGRVTLRAALDGDAVRIEVEDTGPGIPEEEQERVFDAYWQARRTARLGAGLGLAISRGIVESHGGTISVRSRPGLGSTFSFTLPLAGPTPEPTAEVGAVAVT